MKRILTIKHKKMVKDTEEEKKLDVMLDEILDTMRRKKVLSMLKAEGDTLMEEGDIMMGSIMKAMLEGFDLIVERCEKRLAEIKARLKEIMVEMDLNGKKK